MCISHSAQGKRSVKSTSDSTTFTYCILNSLHLLEGENPRSPFALFPKNTQKKTAKTLS